MMSGFRPGNQAKLSPERKYRIREQATQKLAKAYRLDEIACSVTIMQSTSSLEEVASFVLQRNPQDADAKYVHFFHEKIPSRQLAECTSYTALDQIIEDLPSNPEPLRTRGTVRIFKEDFHGAVADYTEALRIHRSHATSHFAPAPAAEHQLAPRTGRRQDDIILKEEEHPSSLETAVLFQRAGVYLSIACQHAGAAFPQQVASEAADLPSEVTEARKLVRSNAKRALRDYTSYLSRFEYSPDLPVGIAEDFVRKVNAATTKEASRIKCRPCRAGSPTNSDNKKSNPSHRIYTVAELFASSPPSDLPPYPPSQITTAGQPADVEFATTTETVTYHPLMTESLHCLLICHCLIQTSAKELLRHAYMVARLARLSDGYPIFQTSRSPARSDWLEILRSTNNFIQLQGTWEDLCAPAPLPHFPYTTPSSQTNLSLAAQTLEIEANPLTSKAEKNAERLRLLRDAERERRQRNAQHQIVMDTLGDERVKDEESFRRALRARQLRAQKDYKLDIAVAGFSNIMARQQQQQQQLQLQHQQQLQLADGTPDSAAAIAADADGTESATNGHGAAADGSPDTVKANGSSASIADGNSEAAALARHQLHQDNDMDYPISTDRAMAVSRWVLEAPPNAGIAPGEGGAKKRKKKPAKKQSGAAVGSGDAAATGTGTVDITGED
ncbi:hypothetical protein QBC42DRAFT_280653 [Cladorrhinum samala]|uniref:Uncharacterized protein n=1 Tax=Cladorrhinum samala TaxID=585594 RepID=A0AAV9H8Y2_9PEZI|nr:hypothetical protein QBC42DRAFT_280653 [Cladorrhinum samala]